MGGSVNQKVVYAIPYNDSLFNHDGFITVTALTKTEGLVTPLAVILRL